MSNDLEARVAELEDRIARLEYRDSQVFHVLVNDVDTASDAHLPLFILNHDLDAEQVKGIMDVIEAAYQALKAGAPFEPLDFEKRLLPFIPAREKVGGSGFYFAQCLLIMAARTGQWYEVCDHYRGHYNVPLCANMSETTAS